MAKSIMGEARAKYYDIRTDLFDYKRMEIDLKIDQIIHNEAIKAKELKDAVKCVHNGRYDGDK